MSEILTSAENLQTLLRKQRESLEKIFGILDRQDRRGIMRNLPKEQLTESEFMGEK